MSVWVYHSLNETKQLHVAFSTRVSTVNSNRFLAPNLKRKYQNIKVKKYLKMSPGNFTVCEMLQTLYFLCLV